MTSTSSSSASAVLSAVTTTLFLSSRNNHCLLISARSCSIHSHGSGSYNASFVCFRPFNLVQEVNSRGVIWPQNGEIFKRDGRVEETQPEEEYHVSIFPGYKMLKPLLNVFLLILFVCLLTLIVPRVFGFLCFSGDS